MSIYELLGNNHLPLTGRAGYNDFFLFHIGDDCIVECSLASEKSWKDLLKNWNNFFFPVHSSALSILHCSGCELKKRAFGKRSRPAGFIIGLSEWGHSQIFFGNSVGKDQSPLFPPLLPCMLQYVKAVPVRPLYSTQRLGSAASRVAGGRSQVFCQEVFSTGWALMCRIITNNGAKCRVFNKG